MESTRSLSITVSNVPWRKCGPISQATQWRPNSTGAPTRRLPWGAPGRCWPLPPPHRVRRAHGRSVRNTFGRPGYM